MASPWLIEIANFLAYGRFRGKYISVVTFSRSWKVIVRSEMGWNASDMIVSSGF